MVMGMKLSGNMVTEEQSLVMGMGWESVRMGILIYPQARLYSVVIVLQNSSEPLDTVLVVSGNGSGSGNEVVRKHFNGNKVWLWEWDGNR